MAESDTASQGLDPMGGFRRYGREEWAALGRPDGDRPDRPEPEGADDMADVLLPLCRLLEVRGAGVNATGPRAGSEPSASHGTGPFVIGITGGVAVGKSTVARQLAELLRGGGHGREVDLFSTDAFLFPNHELEARGLMARKGFPETYDQARLVADLAAIRRGADEVALPVYSHRHYDVVADAVQWIRHPQIVVVEGLTVLQEPPGDGPAPHRYLDFSIYVDGSEADMERWFRGRLMALHRDGDQNSPFFRWFCSLSEAEASAVAAQAWADINLVNLRRHVAPTRARADLILVKAEDHRVAEVLLRSR